ncbi:hypothetical protein [Aquibacillus albus]|uniref:Uncharacterized protein n=1 Tax=Aquibacillus albus TaxID=1168171 RepID=A0ABS2MYL4_9BACI|nr:hypothetical protein [Aquibacillus albus]MBM7570888.1 hypothetical protein [Aquibacillus albus]
MPSAWFIGPLVIKSSLIILLASFIIGFVSFRFTSPFTKTETKEQLNEIGNVLIVFVIFLWVGKIMVHFQTFLNDPPAILAYPSDSRAFYIGIFLTFVYASYKMVRDYQHFLRLFFSWIHVFFLGSFLYEFLQITLGSGTYTWGYLGLLVVLIIIIILLQGKIKLELLVSIAVLGWSAGQSILSIFFHTTVFQFTLSLFFYLAMFVGCLSFIIYRKWGK